MLEGLLVTGLLAVFVGLSYKNPEVDNKNTQYCVADSVHTNPKQERSVVSSKKCLRGSMQTTPSRQTPLSERKAK